MKKLLLMSLFLPTLVGLSGCENPQNAATSTDKQDMLSETQPPIERWYSQVQVERGDVLYQANCASCHKPDASGTADWRKVDAQGKYPPPPLNGSAHAWHHPLSVLRRTVRVGGVPLGGTMPGFGNQLNDAQINDILAWVQSHWSDEIYRIWNERNIQSGKSLQPINKG